MLNKAAPPPVTCPRAAGSCFAERHPDERPAPRFLRRRNATSTRPARRRDIARTAERDRVEPVAGRFIGSSGRRDVVLTAGGVGAGRRARNDMYARSMAAAAAASAPHNM
ncbi:hypothetical protein EVAR_77818_1 [Eumeta japonica]|uniref:Uncharacterized protein n=1 Tax=Eumeta variegata TaxID=151549 RepID=A0A4C1TB19_EUMVA|nr:hypothetical protein EVAR_77818_1 [Eumeta japonica]